MNKFNFTLDENQTINLFSFIDKEIQETELLLIEEKGYYHSDKYWNEFIQTVNARINYLQELKSAIKYTNEF